MSCPQRPDLVDLAVDVVVSLRTRTRTLRASAFRPCVTSQTGLSAWVSMPTKSKTAGIAASPNMSRHAALELKA